MEERIQKIMLLKAEFDWLENRLTEQPTFWARNMVHSQLQSLIRQIDMVIYDGQIRFN